MQIPGSYRKVIEKLLPQGTKRSYYCALVITGIRVILNEGWPSFFRKLKTWLQFRKTALRLNAPGLPKFKASVSRKEAEELAFPEPSQRPVLSIIIPVYNEWEYTVNCLKSICENTQADYEVIVVDDASRDETTKVLSKVRNLHLIKNDENVGFLESCNRGAKASRGAYILFLNNDAMVTKGWLTPMLETIGREDVGAVGSKLIYHDGTLQEAGGVVWNDGSCLNFGRWDDPEKPEYNYTKEVDYCSGACLLVKKKLFDKIGGFDERFKPGYYEDTDLCFSLSILGYKVIYQPMSVVVHVEGVTSGNDISFGIKKYQEINKPKFVEKWNAVLQKYHYSPSSGHLYFERDRGFGKKILVIDHHVPTYDIDSGSLRMFNMLKIFSELGFRVTFIGDNLLGIQTYTQELQQQGIEVIYAPYVLSIEKYIKEYGIYFDLVILSRPHVAIKYIDTVKLNCTMAKIVYDTVDLVFLRESRRAKTEKNEKVLRQAEKSKKVELYLAESSDITFVVSSSEKALLLKENPGLNIAVVSNIHDITKPQKPFSGRKDVLFVGSFGHLPNIDAVAYFVNDIFPLIKRNLPDLHVYIVGSNPTKEVLPLGSSDVTVTGHVKDLTPYFENCKVFVAPLRYGAGVKGKINQSMSYGLPVVTTTIGAEGMALTQGEDILVADEPQKFAESIVLLYNDENLWNKLSRGSIEHVQRNYSSEVTKERLKNVLHILDITMKKNTELRGSLWEMREDWNRRAEKDFRYYTAYSRTEQEFEESGRVHVDDFVTKDLELISGGKEPKKMRTLEIGCGAGRMTGYLGELFGEVHGVDISDEMIRKGKNSLKWMSNVHLYQNNGVDLSMFPDNYFDFAFSYIVFQHIPEKEVIISYIKEAYRVLKPNSLFKFQVQGYLGEEFLRAKKDTWLGVSFSERKIEEIARTLSFKVRNMKGQGTQYFWITLKKEPM